MGVRSINTNPAHSGADRFAQQVTAQAIDFLYANMRTIMFSIVLMPIAMVVVMWSRIDHLVLFAWFGAVVAVILWRLQLSRMYFRQDPLPQEDAPRWGRYFAMTSLASGLLWGGASILFYTPDSTFIQVFIYTCIFGLAVGSINVSSYWLESYYAFSIPALSLCALRLMAEGDGYLWLGLLMLMFMFILVRLARNTNASALETIRLRFENLDLVEKLREEKEIAEAASRDKTRFLASASHDLRQPIHALSMFSEGLRAEIKSERAGHLLASMVRSFDALNHLLSSLLDISKLDAEIVKPNRVDFSLYPLLNQLDEEYEQQAQAKGLAWHVEAGDQVVHSDPALLETMLRNLISNAIRYTREGGITVSSRMDGGEVVVEVADTGIGIAREQHKDIFREFFQLANPERDRSQGLGLGLSIVERLASLLQHRITLDSEPGKGARFAVVLQAGKSHQLAAQQSGFTVTGQWESLGLKVLVIDDEASIRDSMRIALEGWGCEVMLAGDENEALAITQKGSYPQVIVADYRLREGKTGVQAIELLKRESGHAIPAIIISGDTHPERLREAQSSGYTLMHKPVQPAQLRALLRQISQLRG